MSADQPFISVAMMVKNEEAFLDDALASAKAWADEIVVVDTGSTDKTVEIAKAHGAKVSYFEWCNDFSAARNETLRCASGQWVIILDADERLQGPDPAALRAYLRGLPSGYPFNVVTLKVVNTTTKGEVQSELDGIRIIPSDKRLGYKNRVHHLFGSLDAKFTQIDRHHFDGLQIIHLGYDPEVYEARKKGERSLPLIEMMVAENPHDPLYKYYLGRELCSLKRFTEASNHLRDAHNELGKDESADKDLVFDIAWFLIRAMVAAQKPAEETLKIARDVVAKIPNKPDLWYLIAYLLIDMDQKPEALQCFERTIGLMETELSAQEKIGISHIETRRAEIYQKMGELAADTNDMNKAYGAFVQGIEHVPPEKPEQRLELVNCACGIAIDLGDIANLPVLMELLLQIEGAPLDMFFMGLEAISNTHGRATAVDFIKQAKVAYPHLAAHPKTIAWSIQL
ncbi:MAG: glycosyltransferase [Myxococcota bacterium]|nr:glycosyltransferase [Myxococcota bacterium]